MTHVNTHKFLKDVGVNMKRSAAFIESIPPGKGGRGEGGGGLKKYSFRGKISKSERGLLLGLNSQRERFSVLKTSVFL